MVYSLLRRLCSRYSFAANALAYSSLAAGAEFTQQTMTKKIYVKGGEKLPYDITNLYRYAIVGAVFSPIFYKWYQWLDWRFSGTLGRTVAKKVALDQLVLTPPLVGIFYVGMSILEGKEDYLTECKQKGPITFVSSLAFWLPAQSLNFLLVPPQARVAYVGLCDFVFLNILCWFKSH